MLLSFYLPVLGWQDGRISGFLWKKKGGRGCLFYLSRVSLPTTTTTTTTTIIYQQLTYRSKPRERTSK